MNPGTEASLCAFEETANVEAWEATLTENARCFSEDTILHAVQAYDYSEVLLRNAFRAAIYRVFMAATPFVFLGFFEDRLALKEPRYAANVGRAAAALPFLIPRPLFSFWAEASRIELTAKKRHHTLTQAYLSSIEDRLIDFEATGDVRAWEDILTKGAAQFPEETIIRASRIYDYDALPCREDFRAAAYRIFTTAVPFVRMDVFESLPSLQKGNNAWNIGCVVAFQDFAEPVAGFSSWEEADAIAKAAGAVLKQQTLKSVLAAAPQPSNILQLV